MQNDELIDIVNARFEKILLAKKQEEEEAVKPEPIKTHAKKEWTPFTIKWLIALTAITAFLYGMVVTLAFMERSL